MLVPMLVPMLDFRAEAITLPEADAAMDMQLDLPLLESTFDADIAVECCLSHAM